MGLLAATKRAEPPPRPMHRSAKPAAGGSLLPGMAINTLAGLPTPGSRGGKMNYCLSIHDDAGVFVLSLTTVIKSYEFSLLP
jgi:hypothetical protein